MERGKTLTEINLNFGFVRPVVPCSPDRNTPYFSVLIGIKSFSEEGEVILQYLGKTSTKAFSCYEGVPSLQTWIIYVNPHFIKTPFQLSTEEYWLLVNVSLTSIMA